MGAFLTPKTQTPNTILSVAVPDREMQRLLHDTGGAVQLSMLLDNLQQSYTKGVLLVVPELPYTDNYAADFLLRNIASHPQNENVSNERRH